MALLDGRTAVITGGAQGIGFAIAERFVAEGARVVLGELDLDATEAAPKRLGGQSDLSSYMTGTVLEVTGGRFM